MERRQAVPIDVYANADRQDGPVIMLLEESRLSYRVHALSGPGAAALPPGFPAVSADALGVAVVDHDTGLHVFRPGAALQYLAEKTSRFLPADPDGRFRVLQWLHWNAEFDAAPAARLACLEAALADVAYLAGEYSIADMAAWWSLYGAADGTAAWPGAVHAWYDTIRHRPAVHRVRVALETGHTHPE